MDPNTALMALSTIISILNPGGSNGQRGSTYNSGQRSVIDSAIESIRGMGGQDITQNPQYQQGQEWLSDLFNDPEFFQKFEAPLQRQFQEQTVPDLANRFASMGSGGALGSTGFRNQLGREGSNLSTNIAALRGGMQQQGVNQSLQYAQQPFSNFMDMMNGILGHPINNTYQPASNPTAPITGALVQGWAQNRFPGQNASTV